MNSENKLLRDGEFENDTLCLIGAEDQRLVIFCAQNTMLIAPDGDWSRRGEGTAVNYKVPGRGKWQLIYTGGTFRHTPILGSTGEPYTARTVEYHSWEGQHWIAELRHGPAQIGWKPYFFHRPVNLNLPVLPIPDYAVCQRPPG